MELGWQLPISIWATDVFLFTNFWQKNDLGCVIWAAIESVFGKSKELKLFLKVKNCHRWEIALHFPLSEIRPVPYSLSCRIFVSRLSFSLFVKQCFKNCAHNSSSTGRSNIFVEKKRTGLRSFFNKLRNDESTMLKSEDTAMTNTMNSWASFGNTCRPL